MIELETKHDVRVLFKGRNDLHDDNFIYEVEESREDKPSEPKPKRGRPRKDISSKSESKVETPPFVESTFSSEKPVNPIESVEDGKKDQVSKGTGSRRKYARKSSGRRAGAGRGRGKRRTTSPISKVSNDGKLQESREISSSEKFISKGKNDVVPMVESQVNESPEPL